MKEYLQRRSPSATMVVFVLIIIMLLEEGITYSVFLGRLAAISPGGLRVITPTWLAVRVLLMTWVIAMWILNRKRRLFTAIVWTNGFLTLILITNAASLISVLSGASQKTIQIVMLDMFALAISNVLIFSIWYWIMDPPGIDSDAPSNAPWDFLFPQRGNVIEQYENWKPRYSDYLYLAFTTSLAFSPTDTLPLSRRAKMLMLLQTVISVITIVFIAGVAINILS